MDPKRRKKKLKRTGGRYWLVEHGVWHWEVGDFIHNIFTTNHRW